VILFSAVSLLLLPGFVNNFSHAPQLQRATLEIYKDTTHYSYRYVQLFCESGFNSRATSEVKPWKRQGIDTVTAVRTGRAAAGLSQFMWLTARGYNAETINPSAADGNDYQSDIYNPSWAIRANVQFMSDLESAIYRRLTPEQRATYRRSLKLRELYSAAAYNCGQFRVVTAIANGGISWDHSKRFLPAESRVYAERISQLKEKWF
jgi:hypothetical protein